MTADENNRRCILQSTSCCWSSRPLVPWKLQVKTRHAGASGFFRFHELGSRIENSHSKTYQKK